MKKTIEITKSNVLFNTLFYIIINFIIISLISSIIVITNLNICKEYKLKTFDGIVSNVYYNSDNDQYIVNLKDDKNDYYLTYLAKEYKILDIIKKDDHLKFYYLSDKTPLVLKIEQNNDYIVNVYNKYIQNQKNILYVLFSLITVSFILLIVFNILRKKERKKIVNYERELLKAQLKNINYNYYQHYKIFKKNCLILLIFFFVYVFFLMGLITILVTIKQYFIILGIITAIFFIGFIFYCLYFIKYCGFKIKKQIIKYGKYYIKDYSEFLNTIYDEEAYNMPPFNEIGYVELNYDEIYEDYFNYIDNNENISNEDGLKYLYSRYEQKINNSYLIINKDNLNLHTVVVFQNSYELFKIYVCSEIDKDVDFLDYDLYFVLDKAFLDSIDKFNLKVKGLDYVLNHFEQIILEHPGHFEIKHFKD